MKNKTSIHAFHQNIASFVETLSKEGFTLHVPSASTNSNIDTNERIKNLTSLDLNKKQSLTNLKTIHWSKPIGNGNEKLYVHLSFEANCYIQLSFGAENRTKEELTCTKVKCVVTDDPNNFASIKYRHINVPDAERLLKRIETVSNDLLQIRDKGNEEADIRKYNSGLIQEDAKNAFGEDAEISTVLGNWVVIVDYCDTTIKIDTLTVGSNVDVTLFGLTRNISLVKARKLIDSFLAD